MNRIIVSLLTVAVLAIAGGCATSKGPTPKDKREYTNKMAADTLTRLYKEAPDAKAKIDAAAGYGVFSNIGTNIIVVSTGGGYGVVVDNTSKERTYMKMGQLGVGLGIGVKDFRGVFVFKTEEALTRFTTSGWSWGADADAAAKAGDQGGEVSGAGDIAGDIEVYQMTENGLAISATVNGTKYWRDKELNEEK